MNAPHLVALVRAGARFDRGELVERDRAHQALTEPTGQGAPAPDQAVSNAA